MAAFVASAGGQRGCDAARWAPADLPSRVSGACLDTCDRSRRSNRCSSNAMRLVFLSMQRHATNLAPEVPPLDGIGVPASTFATRTCVVWGELTFAPHTLHQRPKWQRG
eukprot:364862-Chlamydomonas_euryale.AAC.10